jgi:hypothetical protein
MPKYLFAILLCVLPLIAQEPNKPQIGNVIALPTEKPVAVGTCAASRSGYLEKDHRTKMKEAEIAKFVSSSLLDGYIVTIYPESKSGIFVNMECPSRHNTKAIPSHP